MSYRVIRRFVDLQDNNHVYEVGAEFPHLNANVSKSRIEELASNRNRRKVPLIQEIKEVKEVVKPVEPEITEEKSEVVDSEKTSKEPVKKRKASRKKGKNNANTD